MAVSCETGAPVDRAEPSPSATTTSPAPSGGKVTFAVLGEPPTLDPFSDRASDLTLTLARPVYRSLYRTRPDGAVEADLAHALTRRGRNSVLLRIGDARWSDGDPITARDVVRSVERARYPSGLEGLEARATGPRAVELSGDVTGDWETRLADASFVVPGRADGTVGSGPLVVTRYEPGLELVFERNPRYDGDPALLDRITVRFVATLEIMLELVGSGRVDAAAPPSAMNLDDRLDARDITFDAATGREAIVLELGGIEDSELRAAVASAIDTKLIDEGLIRDEGRPVDNQRHIGDAGAEENGGDGAEIRLGTVSGDELLQLMQRIIQRNLSAGGVGAELVQVDPATFYGPWQNESPLDASLGREIVGSSRGMRAAADLSWVPLFVVDSFVIWNEGLAGPVAHGGLDGPLWNAEEWWLE